MRGVKAVALVMKVKKSAIIAVLFVLSFAFLAGCRSAPSQEALLDSIGFYLDIPGVTPQEIAAIEALRKSGREYTYGVLNSTEAFISNEGELDGFAVLFCELLSTLFGMQFNVKTYGWMDLIYSLEDRTLDFTGELTPTEARQGSRFLLFEEEGAWVPGREYVMSAPIAERMLRIFTLADSPIRREADIAGLRVGFLEEAGLDMIIKRAYRIDFEAVEIIIPRDAEYGTEYDIAVHMLRSGEIDAFVMAAHVYSAFVGYHDVRSAVFFPMIHSSASFATANRELAPIVSVLNKFINAGGADVLVELYQEGDFRYAKKELYNAYTPEERRFIDNMTRLGAAVSVGFEHDNYPLSFFNKATRQFEGIAVDVLTEISELTGLSFEPAVAYNATWGEIYDKLMSGEVDMVPLLIPTEQRKNRFLWSSVPYASTQYALMSRIDTPFLRVHQVPRMKVGAMRSSGKISVFNDLFPNTPLVEFPTQDACHDALERGEIELLMATQFDLLYEINYRERSGLKINIMLDIPMEAYFGFHLDNKVLRSIVDKAQQHVDTEAIALRWAGRQFDYFRVLTEQRNRYLMIIISGMILVLAAMAFVLAKNVKLSGMLKKMASHDALTGVYNRRHFMELAAQQKARSERTGTDCYIILFDLDYFKSVNDTHGHLAGDKVLKDIAQRIQHTIRPYDIFARYGGEEFVILMADTKEFAKEDVINATERIRQIVCKTPIEFDGKEIFVSASFGAAYVAPQKTFADAIEFADRALYQAKKAGRNKVVFYQE